MAAKAKARAKERAKDKCLTPAEIQAETKSLASDLAFCARRPVSIQLVGGEHIAYTYDTDQTKRTIPIVMNPSILDKVRNKERATRIWRGIGFHELAHHLWPAGEQYKIAHKEGFRHLFNLVDDEQNERRGRAFDASWGACFQSVCAFIFPGKEQSEEIMIPGIVDGDKPPKTPKGRAATKKYIKRWNLFAYHFRRHIPDCSDAIVAEALALIPKRFMDLSKGELLELTRQIHETLARDIVLPTVDPNAKAVQGKPGEKPKPDQEEDDDDDDDGDDEEPPEPKPEPEPEPEPEEDPKEEPPAEKGSWSWRKLFRSKWTYVPFGVFVALWFFLLMQGGVNFWVKTAINALIGCSLVTGYLFYRRAQIKAMLAAIKAAMTPTPGAGRSTRPPRDSARVKRIAGYVIKTGIVGGLSYACFRNLPLPMALLLTSVAGTITATVWFFKARSAAREKDPDSAPSKLAIAGIIAASIVSLGIFLYSLKYMGIANFWLNILAGIFAFFVLIASVMLVNDHQVAHAGGRLTPWQRCKRAIALTRDCVIDAVKGFFATIWNAVWDFVTDVWSVCWGFVCRVAQYCWRKVVLLFRRIQWKVSGPLLKAWRNPILRVAIIALPVAILLVIIYALITKAGAYGWWVALIVALLLLALLVVAWIYRKKIKRFVVQELFMPMPQLMDAGMMPPLDMETEWFNQIDESSQIEPDQQMMDELLPEIYPLAQQLRPFLARCGRAPFDIEDQVDGFDLTEEADLALVGETSIWVNDDVHPKASVHLEIALDCSSSMNSPTVSLGPGEKFRLGKFFALVLEQAVINLPGVSAHFWGFTHDQIYDCGVAGEGRVSGLQCGGGNNDAAMLWQMGQSAADSGKDVKILIMLSDGQPSDCSWLSLHNLVMQFEQEGMIPWNFALDVISTPAFERFFTDLVGQTMSEAIVTMGETLATLAEEGI
ncbi:MAG: hypothetical protein KGS72_04595 [Cyanobacteria bacterium REEB67]|nr:hypothetical protein [Cyanobacteria bacterium REEB67]